MATTINAGRVRFVSRGTYNNSTQYYLFDLVDYNGSSYIAKENSLGNLPTNTQYWQLIAEKGNTGSTGQTGPVGATGNGIATITKTSTVGLVDTYTITYTNGNTTTFTITNGEDGEVTETELDVLRQKVANQQKVIDQLPQVTGQGTSITLENTIEAQFTKFEIEGNSTQDGTPSPDNEQPIKSAGENGSITEKIVNKNLVEKNLKGFINTAGYMRMDNASESFVFWAEQGKTYKYSCLKRTNRGVCAKSETINIVNETPLTNIREVSNSFTSNFTGWCVLYVNSSLDNEIKDSFMIEQGSTATDYIPHEEQTYTIPTQQPMRSIGDVRDKFVKVNGNWYERHYISRKVFDGTENWIYDVSNPRFIFDTSDIFQYTDSDRHNSVLSNYYQAKTTGTNNIIFQYQTQILIYDTEHNSSTDYKSWLATKYANRTPLYMDYILKNPLDLPCTEEQIQQLENLPSTYKDFTIINSEDETPAYLEVSGIYDLNNLINN